jgi:xanthine/uracil permease
MTWSVGTLMLYLGVVLVKMAVNEWWGDGNSRRARITAFLGFGLFILITAVYGFVRGPEL